VNQSVVSARPDRSWFVRMKQTIIFAWVPAVPTQHTEREEQLHPNLMARISYSIALKATHKCENSFFIVEMFHSKEKLESH
jgi:hypothetical protein